MVGRQAPSGPTGVTHGQVQWGGCLPGRELDTHRQCPPLRIPGEEAATLQGSRASRPGRSHGGSGSPPPPLSSSIRSVMQKYLEDRAEVTFEKIFSQKLGEYGGGSANPRASAPPPGPAARPGGGGRRPLGLPLCGTPADQAVCPPLCQAPLTLRSKLGTVPHAADQSSNLTACVAKAQMCLNEMWSAFFVSNCHNI